MSADATDILTAVKSVLTALYQAIPVMVSKRRAASERNMAGGFQEGFPSTCFVVSCGEPEEIAKLSTFTRYAVGYPVSVEYVRPAQAAVANAPNGGAATVVEDPDVREKRAAIRAALYKPKLAGASVVFNVTHRSLGVYDSPGDGKAVRLVSGELFIYSTTEPRPVVA